MRNKSELSELNLDTIPITEIKDYNKIFNEISEFLIKLKSVSQKWYNFFLVKINSGLDYTDLVNLKRCDLKELNGYIVININRNKTKCETYSILTNKITLELKKYLKGKKLNTEYLFTSENNNTDKIKSMNPKSINQTIFKKINQKVNSKVLRSITNEILNLFGNLTQIEKDFYSKVWLGHKVSVHNKYTNKLRDISFFQTIFIENYEKIFNQILGSEK